MFHTVKLLKRGHATGTRHHRALPGCSGEDAMHPLPATMVQGLLAEGTTRLGCRPHHSTQAVDNGGNGKKKKKKQNQMLL